MLQIQSCQYGGTLYKMTMPLTLGTGKLEPFLLLVVNSYIFGLRALKKYIQLLLCRLIKLLYLSWMCRYLMMKALISQGPHLFYRVKYLTVSMSPGPLHPRPWTFQVVPIFELSLDYRKYNSHQVSMCQFSYIYIQF